MKSSKTISRKSATLVTRRNGRKHFAEPVPNSSPQAYLVYDFLTLIASDHVRVENPKEVSEIGLISVETVDASDDLVAQLFEEFKKRPEVAELLLEGTHVDATKKGLRSITKNQNYGTPHESLVCPLHGCSMMKRKGPQGGFFYGCAQHHRVGCRIAMGLDGSWSDPNGFFQRAVAAE